MDVRFNKEVVYKVRFRLQPYIQTYFYLISDVTGVNELVSVS